jgi:Cu/Ag efflux protein CusF
VRRVDKAAGKVTLRHGDLKELEMPPMSMVFEVKDKALLDTVKAGDKVKFKATDDNGKLVIIEMKHAN